MTASRPEGAKALIPVLPWHGCGGDCKAEQLPHIAHPLFGETSLSYHDLAHVYLILESQLQTLRGENERLARVVEMVVVQRDREQHLLLANYVIDALQRYEGGR